MLFMLFPTFPPPLPFLLLSWFFLKNPSKPSSTEAQWTSRLRQVEKQVVVWQGGVWTQGPRQKGQSVRSLRAWTPNTFLAPLTRNLTWTLLPHPSDSHLKTANGSSYTPKGKKLLQAFWFKVSTSWRDDWSNWSQQIVLKAVEVKHYLVGKIHKV